MALLHQNASSNSSFLSLSLDTEWNETQFATELRLRTEAASVEEIHFTPGTPLFVKGKLTNMF